MNSLLKVFSVSTVSLVFLFSGGKGNAQFDEKSEEIIKQAIGYNVGLKEFSFELYMRIEMMEPEKRILFEKKTLYAVERPNKFRNSTIPGEKPEQDDHHGNISEYVSDGVTITSFSKFHHEYFLDDAPEELGTLQGRGLPKLPLISASYADAPYKDFLQDYDSGKYVGIEERNGSTTHHVIVMEEGVEWNLWLENSETPVLHEMSGFVEENVLMTMKFEKWELENLPEDIFDFKLPADAELIEDFRESNIQNSDDENSTAEKEATNAN